VSGNLKYDINLTSAIEKKRQQLSSYLPKKRFVWLVASTHSGDDELILKAFSQLKGQYKNLLLILAPRHPERFDDVAQLCLSQQFNLVRRSEKRLINENDDIWLLDSLGELAAAYSLASVVTIAGTFSTIGGHNPLEAALYKKAIVVGPDMANFSEVQQLLLQNQAIVQLTDTNNISAQLGEKISQLLSDSDYCYQLGENAYQVMLQNQGASLRSVNKLIEVLSRYT
jgi:3-deoxy-D-manno-octulosonic-acid transferase